MSAPENAGDAGHLAEVDRVAGWAGVEMLAGIGLFVLLGVRADLSGAGWFVGVVAYLCSIGGAFRVGYAEKTREVVDVLDRFELTRRGARRG